MQSNLEIVQQGYQSFLKGDIPGMLETLSDDIEWVLPASAHVSFSGLFKGKQGVLEFFQNVAAENDIEEFVTDTFISDGDHVVVLGHLGARAKSTGKASENKWAHVWKLQDGKVLSHYEYADTAEIRDAFSR